MRVVAFDPGLSGGVAILDGDYLTTFPMPVLKVGRKRAYDLDAMLRVMQGCGAGLCVIEAITRPGALVGNGMFLHGLAMACGIEVMRPRPQQWKHSFGLTNIKQESIDLIHELFPQTRGAITLRKQDGLAEAALLAVYGRNALETR